MSKISKRKKVCTRIALFLELRALVLSWQADRLKNSPHLESLVRQQKKTGCDYCLTHFDEFYGKTYGDEWSSLRLALLSRPKFSALVNNFAPLDRTRSKLTQMGCYSMAKAYNVNAKRFLESYRTPEVTELKAIPRPEQPEEEAEEVIESMTEEIGAQRIIKPDEQILAGSSPHLSGASAAMFNHIPPATLIGLDDVVEESEYYSKYEQVIPQHDSMDGVIPIQLVKMRPLVQLPKHFDAWTFPTGAAESRLAAPERGALGTHDYYCMDAASLLPVLMLDIQPGNVVLDMCAAPGGKSLAMLQTLHPEKLVCNDNQSNRLLRVRHVMNAYLKTNDKDYSEDLVEFSCNDAETLAIKYESKFDRVLCDVECTTDRHSLSKPDGNWFNPSFKKLRIRLPETQSAILQ